MSIFIQEIKLHRLTWIIWTLAIGFMMAVAVMMYPEMQSQMTDISEAFSSMGKFTTAFGMDKLDFGTIKGYYGVEAGNVMGIGGAFFAAILGIGMLMKEEQGRTAEFLFTHPVSRTRVITEKLLSIFVMLLAMNLVILIFGVGAIMAIGEEPFLKEILLIQLAYFLMELEISGITFGISAFIRKAGLGIGIGLAGLLYMLNILANITEEAKALKYFTPFGFTDSSEIMTSLQIPGEYLATGMAFLAAGIVAAYLKYRNKDLMV